MFWPFLERGDNLTAIINNEVFREREYEEQEECSSEIDLQDGEGNRFSGSTVRRVVAEKSEISGVAFTSLAKRYKITTKRIVLDVSTPPPPPSLKGW